MLSLLRKSAELLRQHPVLWAPYICANLCASGLTQLRSAGTKATFYWLAVKRWHAAPGSNGAASAFYASVQTVQRLNSALIWGTTYVEFSIDATAMVLTAILVARMLRQRRLELAAAKTGLRGYPGRILIYALKFWVLYLALDVVLLEAGTLFKPLLHLSDPAGSALTTGVDSVAAVFFAWVMAPVALRLLRPAGAPALSKTNVKLGRYCFMLTVAVSLILGWALDPLFDKLLSDSIGTAGEVALASLLAQIPFVWLYIALALLASKAALERGERKGTGGRERLPDLVPLNAKAGRKS